jgi:hypothetical protein
MGNRTVLARIRRLGEQAVDRCEYAVFSGRLKMVDWLYGPEPPTEADRDRSESGFAWAQGRRDRCDESHN